MTSQQSPVISSQFQITQPISLNKPTDSPYGYSDGESFIGCTKEQLIDLCKQGGVPALDFVWTPEHETLVAPGEVDFLLTLHKTNARKRAINGLLLGLGLIGLVILIVIILGRPWWNAFRNLWFVLGAATIVFSIWSILKSRHLTAKDVAERTQAIKFAKWLETKDVVYTKYLAALLIIVGFAEMIFGLKESINAAGLVKPAVWQGEIWRLLTCATLHGSSMHIVVNLQSLWAEGKVIENIAHRAHLPIVFLLSALGGSILSLLLYPDTISIGASGGLMGLIGYQLVLGRRRKEMVPAGFYKSVVVSILGMGVLGIVGFALIDNAAHLGGLLAGAVCGGYLIGKEEAIPVKPEKWVELMAYGSLIIIGIICLWSIVVMAKAALDRLQ
jgi:membrane associated rhomboid family serine protease